MDWVLKPIRQTREHLYFCYKVELGARERWGEDWWITNPERVVRLQYEIRVITELNNAHYFLILARIMERTREKRIITGPGRGSAGGSLVAFCLGIHELDSLEWGLSFERFLNPNRVGLADVDIDVSQRHRQEVLEFIREEFENEETAVLQVAAFARAGARRTIDMVFVAKSQEDPAAGSIAEQLKKLLPDGANVTGGTKQEREIAWWLENGIKSNRNQFRKIAEDAGWLPLLLKLDGIQTHLTSHAAGVVIINRSDLKRMPQTSADGFTMMTGYDMYSLDDLKYLKIDILGLRTLDIMSDAHIFCGGDGTIRSLMKLWEHERNRDTNAYDLLCAADTTGVFQVETSGYRKTLKDFQPRTFEHIVQLNALYRPGALDSYREDGKNMVQVFIERLHGREPVNYPEELRDVLKPILSDTQGIILYQEQSMKIARVLAGFTEAESDDLRKAIGKKQLDRMATLKPKFIKGMEGNGYSKHAAETQFGAIESSARYAWNLSHASFYAIPTWVTAYFKANNHISIPDLEIEGPGTAGFYAALINSLDKDKDRQADAVAEARQHIPIKSPDINIAQDGYTVDGERVVFGLNGIKGMGEANRTAILLERWLSGPFQSFEDFHRRLPSVPINMKLSLIRCGAFDSMEGRERLLATVQIQPERRIVEKKTGETKLHPAKYATVAEFIKHNTGLKKPRDLPPITEWVFPTNKELADGEMDTIGFYVSADPMADVTQALKRLDPSAHWGGEIVAGSLKTKPDKNMNTMGWFTVLTTALTKKRCMIFSSNWDQCKSLIKPGQHVILRGREDGTQLIIDAVFPAGDYRIFRVMILEREGKREVVEFDGLESTIDLAEQSGYKVHIK